MIWYACYGSNMDYERFLKYIQGGQLIVNNKTKEYKACPTDVKPPEQSEPYSIDRRLFFAKESNTWNQHGVAFISNKRNKNSKTFAKLYLISEDQFSHLFAQENGRSNVRIDYKHLFENGYLDFDYNFYNRILVIEKNHKGFPVLTFTNKSKLLPNKPFVEYASLIINSLISTHNLTTKEAFDYIVRNDTGASRKDLKEKLYQHKMEIEIS